MNTTYLYIFLGAAVAGYFLTNSNTPATNILGKAYAKGFDAGTPKTT